MSRPLVVRGVALFLGSMAALDVVMGANSSGGALVAWWSSTYAFPLWSRVLFSASAALLLIGYAMAPRMRPVRRLATEVVLAAIALRCSIDVARVLQLNRAGIVTAVYLPLSIAFLAASLAMLAAVMRSRRGGRLYQPPPAASLALVMGWAGASALLFAFAQMVGFGNADYRRPADAVVVFGARVYQNGQPSLALADRVRTAAMLVRDGYAPLLIVSGGPGDGSVHEAEAMRDIAIAVGVRPEAIVLDRQGLTTRATVHNTVGLLADRHATVLAVSHSYHLPRIKLSFEQEGVHAYTVPAHETRTLLRLPWYMARETLAFWAHAFRLA